MAIDIKGMGKDGKDIINVTWGELRSIVYKEMKEAISNEDDSEIIIRVY